MKRSDQLELAAFDLPVMSLSQIESPRVLGRSIALKAQANRKVEEVLAGDQGAHGCLGARAPGDYSSEWASARVSGI